MGEGEGELTLETEKQMVKPCASARQHEDLQRVVEVYQTGKPFFAFCERLGCQLCVQLWSSTGISCVNCLAQFSL